MTGSKETNECPVYLVAVCATEGTFQQIKEAVRKFIQKCCDTTKRK